MYKQKEELFISKDMFPRDYDGIIELGLFAECGEFLSAYKFLTIKTLSDGRELALVVLKSVDGSKYGKDFVLDFNGEFELDGFDDVIDFHLVGLTEVVKVDYAYKFANGYSVE